MLATGSQVHAEVISRFIERPQRIARGRALTRDFHRLALDAPAQISALRKLKLGSCARPDFRAGFCWALRSIQISRLVEDKHCSSSFAQTA
jgi:hypothetical protein